MYVLVVSSIKTISPDVLETSHSDLGINGINIPGKKTRSITAEVKMSNSFSIKYQ